MGKKAIIVSGGGSKGAFSTGAVKALLESGKSWDYTIGVSVGSLIAAFLAQHNKPDQKEAIVELEKIWLDLGGDGAVYKRHAPGFLTYLWSLWKGGIYDMSPLRDLISKKLDLKKLSESEIKLLVGVVSLNSGKYHAIDKQNKDILDFIWASCIFPVLFSPVKIGDEIWVDGGIRHQIPLSDVFDFKDIDEVDVILSSPRGGHVYDTPPSNKFSNILNVATRGAAILSDEVYVNDMITHAIMNHIKINIWDPTEEVNDDSFKFDKEEIKVNLEKGYIETKRRLNETKHS